MDLEVPLEPGVLREPGLVERLDLGEMLTLVGELLEDRIAAAVAQALVLGVDAEIRREDRVVAQEAAGA